MIHLIFCLRRLPHLSREEFQRYWRETHAPLVRRHAAALGICRYIQAHTIAHPVAEAARMARGAEEEYDGVAELWFDSLEAVMENGARPEAQQAGLMLLEDERRFIDLEKSPLWWAHEREIVAFR